jgi:molybdopterin converting factor subunit 1
MTITVLYFARIRSLLGTSRETYETHSTVDDLVKSLILSHPALEKFMDTCAIAVNETYVERTHTLNDGDTVALIPPVAGG